MTSKIQTSTPIIFPKPDNQSLRKSWLNQDVTQRLYRNVWSQFKSPDKSEQWDSIEGPKFFNLKEESSQADDTFFDGRQPDCPSPQSKETMVLPTSDEAMEIVDCFQSCSISSIENSSTDIEDKTLVAENMSQLENQFADVSKCQRRQSQIIVKPFSFELREKENQERRESRRVYYKLLTEKAKQTFKAKPAPKFTKRPTAAPVTNEVKTETPHRKIIRVPRKEDIASVHSPKPGQKIEKKAKIMNSIQSEQKTTNLIKSSQFRQSVVPECKLRPIMQKAKSSSNPLQSQKSKVPSRNVHPVSTTKPIRKVKSEFATNIQKGFQVNVANRQLEHPKSPKLLTAKRARDRQLFEEKIKERERQTQEIKKKEAAAQRAKELEEIARLRKMTVFKAKPVPQYKNVLPQVPKRPLTEPLMPIFIKRRRFC